MEKDVEIYNMNEEVDRQMRKVNKLGEATGKTRDENKFKR